MTVMRTPRSVEIEITSRCNLSCRYCFFFSSPADVNNDLPFEEWDRFFQELNRCAVTHVCLAGGEPFYRSDIKEIIAAIASNRMRFNVLSNGTLISGEMAAFLANTRRCDSVQVSLDGAVPITHDSFRGKGTFYKAIRGINNLKDHGVPVAVRVTIHRQNVNDLENIARLLLEEIGLPSFSTNAASYLGLCRQNQEMVQLTAEERVLAMAKLLKLSQKYEGRIIAQAGPLAEARMWLKMEHAFQKGLESFEGGFLTACGGVQQKLAVRADGVMVPCSLMPQMELGRINKDSLEEVWQHSPLLKKLRFRSGIPLNSFEFCRGCQYIDYCTGNCPALAYTLTGEENHPSPDACLKRFLEEGGRLPSAEMLMS